MDPIVSCFAGVLLGYLLREGPAIREIILVESLEADPPDAFLVTLHSGKVLRVTVSLVKHREGNEK